MTAQIPCNLCRGAMTLRHQQPPEMPLEEWQKIVAWGKCPLCKGLGIQPSVRIPIGKNPDGTPVRTEVVPRNVFFWHSKATARVWAACLEPTCGLWADASAFVSLGRPHLDEPVAECPAGHKIRMTFTVKGA